MTANVPTIISNPSSTGPLGEWVAQSVPAGSYYKWRPDFIIALSSFRISASKPKCLTEAFLGTDSSHDPLVQIYYKTYDQKPIHSLKFTVITYCVFEKDYSNQVERDVQAGTQVIFTEGLPISQRLSDPLHYLSNSPFPLRLQAFLNIMDSV